MPEYVLDESHDVTTVSTIEVVCPNNPQLQKLYERAKELGFTRLADNIAKACERIR